MLHLVVPTWNEGRSDFHDAMATEVGWHRLPQSLRDVEEEEENREERRVAEGKERGKDDVTYYHRRLLTSRPLAHLTNAVIDGFNE